MDPVGAGVGHPPAGDHREERRRPAVHGVPESDEDVTVDCILLNTCGFIGDAKEESVDAILHAVERKKAGRAGTVIVFGCLSQRYAEELPGLIPEVDAWFGARDFGPVVRALGVTPSDLWLTGRHLTTPRHYAYLKISEGCDRRCSYCAIPFIRGRHRSVPMEQLVGEARLLALKGVRELIVIAQDTTFYGLDLYHRRALAELLQRLSEIDGIEWIRVHYSYPDDFPDDVCSQGYCSQFRSPVFRDEDGGQGIVAESGAYRQAVRQAPGGQ